MSIDFSNEQEQTFDFDFLKVAEDVMETVLDQEGCPYESQVCLVLTDNETIHKTNLEYRQIDRATDVLSFPMVDFPATFRKRNFLKRFFKPYLINHKLQPLWQNRYRTIKTCSSMCYMNCWTKVR